MGILARRMVCLGQDPAEFASFRGECVMANDDMPPKNKSDQPERAKLKAAPKPPKDRPFDMWLQKQLHAMYDEIASEPLPSDLLNLIETDEGKSKK